MIGVLAIDMYRGGPDGVLRLINIQPTYRHIPDKCGWIGWGVNYSWVDTLVVSFPFWLKVNREAGVTSMSASSSVS